MELVEMTYEMTRKFAKTEQFGLTGQMRRAAVSIPTNIAEGAARQTVKEALQFYFIARGSLSELDTLTELSCRVGVASKDESEQLSREMGRVSSLLQGLITHNQGRPER